MNKRRQDYSALKRKLFLSVLLMAGAAVAIVLLFRAISTGKLATGIVEAISRYFRLDMISASKIYFYGIRNWLDLILVFCCIGLFLLFFRAFLNRFTGYLDEVALALDSLGENTAAPIELSPELSAMENRLKTLQQSMERKESRSREDQQKKNDLLIYSAHDIKTPLTSALGYLMLLDGKPDMPADERARYTGIALSKTRELDGMINELFEITRYNLHEIELEKSWVDLYAMFSEIKEEHYPRLKARNMRTEIEMEENIRIFADGDKLARVFNNIFKNALQYGEADSGILISARSAGEQVEIAFENKCPPMSDAKLRRLFDQFYRGREEEHRGISGSGLGLAIAKEIVTLHGGSLRAENTEKGIRFLLYLPLSPEIIKEN